MVSERVAKPREPWRRGLAPARGGGGRRGGGALRPCAARARWEGTAAAPPAGRERGGWLVPEPAPLSSKSSRSSRMKIGRPSTCHVAAARLRQARCGGGRGGGGRSCGSCLAVVHALDRVGRRVSGLKLDDAAALRLVVRVAHDVRVDDDASLSKGVFQVLPRGFPRQVADINPTRHRDDVVLAALPSLLGTESSRKDHAKKINDYN